MIPRIPPMTCSSSKKIAPTPEQAIEILTRDGYFYETKLDGVRVVAYIEDGVVTLVNRRMVETTGRYPEVVAGLAAAFPTGSKVFDGEVVCYKDGKPAFERIHKRDAQPVTKTATIAKLAADWPATFVVFDLLHNDGDNLRDVPYFARRKLLQVLVSRTVVSAVEWIKSDTAGKVMWAFTNEHGLEGLIAKAKNSRYTPGRSSTWIKLKKVDSVSCVAVGYDFGEGSRSGRIGAIKLALVEGANTIDVGRVGTGFTEKDLDELKTRMDAGELLVLEVEYANWGAASKKLRFPSYKGIRTDVAPTDCTLDQLNPQLMLGDEAVAALVSR